MNLPKDITMVVQNAIDEDVSNGDITAELIMADTRRIARVVCRDAAVLSGTAWFDETFRQLSGDCAVTWNKHDGDRLEVNDIVCSLEGPARALVTGERTALNFLQTLSGTATITREYIDQLSETKTLLLDTRKTIPRLRSAQKYAVICGGGENHRFGLFDGILIKENHLEAAGSISAAITAMRTKFPDYSIEIEIESVADIDPAIEAGANMLLLDNFSIPDLRAAVKQTRARVKLEASGGIELEDIRAVAETGVDFVSVGALTKHLRAVDFSMRFITSDSNS